MVHPPEPVVGGVWGRMQQPNQLHNRLLTTREVADRYPVCGSAATLCRMRRDGRGPRYFRLRGACLYDPRDVEAWIESRSVEPEAAG